MLILAYYPTALYKQKVFINILIILKIIKILFKTATAFALPVPTSISLTVSPYLLLLSRLSSSERLAAITEVLYDQAPKSSFIFNRFRFSRLYSFSNVISFCLSCFLSYIINPYFIILFGFNIEFLYGPSHVIIFGNKLAEFVVTNIRQFSFLDPFKNPFSDFLLERVRIPFVRLEM